MQSVRALAERLQVAPDGSRVIVRFSRSQIREHWILMITFTGLAVTGLLQTLSEFGLVAWIMNILGGIDNLRTIHHLMAFLTILHTLYHVYQVLVTWIVKRERGGMWPELSDFRNTLRTVMFNVGLGTQKPDWDRFSIEEKIEYWAMLWGTPVMTITGLIMLFPIMTTRLLPGDAIPVSRAIHRWEAILAVLAILTWHMYHTVIKEKNRSIFDGTMSEEEMQHAHPREYRRILAAHEYLQKANSRNNRDRSEIPAKETSYEAG